MRYKALTNMTTKTDRQAANVLLYLSKCAKAIERIEAPEGIKLLFSTVPSDARTKKIVARSSEIYDQVREELNLADAAADRASRKVKKGK